MACVRRSTNRPKIMKTLKRFSTATGVALACLLGGSVRAQPAGPGGAGFPNLDPQQMQNVMQLVRNMDPAQLQEMMQQVQNLDPQQMQGAMQQLLTMDPQQMQKALEERSSAALRQEFGVESDAEWLRIDEKIKAVTKARAAVAADNAGATVRGGMRGGFGGGARR